VVKEAKLYIFKDKYAKFMTLEDESELFIGYIFTPSLAIYRSFHYGQEQKQMIENL
jgi:hypothetical protein